MLTIANANFVFRACRARLLELCHSLYANSDSKEKIFCSECHRHLCCRNKSGNVAARTNVIINHACAHSAKPLFECCMCSYTAATKAAIRTHVSRAHGLRQTTGLFKDLTPNLRGGRFRHFEQVLCPVGPSHTGLQWNSRENDHKVSLTKTLFLSFYCAVVCSSFSCFV